MADLRIAVTLVLALHFPVFTSGQLQMILRRGAASIFHLCLVVAKLKFSHCGHNTVIVYLASVVFLSVGITVRLGNQEYTNHSVVFVGDMPKTARATMSGELQCQGSRNCCGTDGHWYYPDGTPVTNTAGGPTLYMTRGGDNQDVLYLRRDSAAREVAASGGRGVGLYRCQIPASGTNGVIQIIYIGVYRGNIIHDKGNFHTRCFALQSYGERRGIVRFTCMCFSSTVLLLKIRRKKINSNFISPKK